MARQVIWLTNAPAKAKGKEKSFVTSVARRATNPQSARDKGPRESLVEAFQEMVGDCCSIVVCLCSCIICPGKYVEDMQERSVLYDSGALVGP